MNESEVIPEGLLDAEPGITAGEIPDKLYFRIGDVAKLAGSTPVEKTIYVPKVYASRLADRRYPTRGDLDKAAPGRVVPIPVVS